MSSTGLGFVFAPRVGRSQYRCAVYAGGGAGSQVACPFVLRIRYALSSTELGYGATRRELRRCVSY
eukprot:287496-Rhodomonas_salina.3